MVSVAPSRPSNWRVSKPPMVPLLLTFLAVLVVGGVLAYLGGMFGTRQAAPAYQTAPVTRGTVTNAISATGPITSPASLPLTFKSAGRLSEVKVAVGQRVEKGDELARLETADLQATVDQAQASLNEVNAAYAKLVEGPTSEVVASADAKVSAATLALATAQNDLEAAQTSAAQSIKVAQASVDAAQVKVGTAQRSFNNVQAQAETATAGDQVALETARKNLETAQVQYEKNMAASRTALVNAQKSLLDAQKSFEATQRQLQQEGVADRVALQNAENDLRDVKNDAEQTRRKAEVDYQVAQRQLAKAEADLNTAEAQRKEACKETSTSSCSVAKRQEDSSEASVATTRKQVDVSKVQGQQSVVSAQASITKAESAIKTAQTTLASNQARAAGTLATAQSQVNSAANAINTAQSALEKDEATQNGSLVQAQSAFEQAQATLNTNFSKVEGTLVTAQNSVDESVSALKSSQASYGDAKANAETSVQTAQAQVSQAASALETAQTDAMQTTAHATQSDLDAAQAKVDNARSALTVAQNNLQAATLVAPTGGTVANVSGSVGQFITLTDISAPNVTAQISEADIGRVVPGQKVTFTLSAFPGRTFTATVARIDPVGQVVSNVVTYSVVSTVDPTDVTLLPTMTATVSIITQQAADVLVIPNSALSFATEQATTGAGAPAGGAGAGGQRRAGAGGQPQAAQPTDPTQGRTAVAMVLTDGQAIMRQIQVGTSDERNTQVIAGLEPGDQVITGQAVTGTTTTPARTQNSGGLLPSGPGGGGAPKPGGR
jgi:HlyD family secretion protein